MYAGKAKKTPLFGTKDIHAMPRAAHEEGKEPTFVGQKGKLYLITH